MNLKNIFTYKRNDFKYICDRLKEIRLELKREHALNSDKKNPYTREQIAKLLNIQVITLSNIETSTFTDNSLKLIHLYYSYGYNSNWILIKENDFINKKIMQENVLLKRDMQDGYKQMRENIIKEMDAYKDML